MMSCGSPMMSIHFTTASSVRPSSPLFSSEGTYAMFCSTVRWGNSTLPWMA